MSNEQKLQKLVTLVDNVCAHPDVDVDYFIPGVCVTNGEENYLQEPYVAFTYHLDGDHQTVMHLSEQYLEKSPEDLANLITFSLEQFIAEIDSRQYGAQ